MGDKRRPLIVFRADASNTLGTGHVKRCLVLARAFQKCGYEPLFLSRTQPGDLISQCRSEGFDVLPMPAPGSVPPNAAQDARESSQRLQRLDEKPAWLILDKYELGASWEQALRPLVERILVIDGQGKNPHDCDLLLNPNPVTESLRKKYQLNPDCKTMMGLDYFLLDERFKSFESHRRVRDTIPERILVSLGGSDEPNDTLKSISALLARNRIVKRIDVVLGQNYQYEEELRRTSAGAQEVHIHRSLPSLAPLIAAADLGITAGGGTKYELCYMGVPSLVLISAENQRISCEWMADEGMIFLLGDSRRVDVGGIGKALDELWEKPERLRRLSEAALSGVDGRGIERIVESLESFRGKSRVSG